MLAVLHIIGRLTAEHHALSLDAGLTYEYSRLSTNYPLQPEKTLGFLKPRLEQLRGSAAKLTIDLAMLSHVDDDHVNGILQMTLVKDAFFLHGAGVGGHVEDRDHSVSVPLVDGIAPCKRGSTLVAASVALVSTQPVWVAILAMVTLREPSA